MLPDRFLREPKPDNPFKGEVNDLFPSILDDYYEAWGWDKTTGIPTTKKLTELGLKATEKDLTVIRKKPT